MIRRELVNVEEKLWCSWQMRQSLHPIRPLLAVSSELGVVTDEALLLPGLKLPACLCAASIVVP
ncbi:MAG: hypothetical protein M3539_11430 [Acidobacteriota bacterium]|nr:hypothetical protein [Acidobacteriota bacterium]